MKQFIINIRNITAFVFSWFVIVWLVIHTLIGNQSILLSVIWQLLIISFLGAITFSVIFMTSLLKKVALLKKITLFMVICTNVESLLIYQFGLFGITTIKQWILFIGIVFGLYAISVGFFKIYKKRVSEEYTTLLQNYQMIRRDEYDN